MRGEENERGRGNTESDIESRERGREQEIVRERVGKSWVERKKER